MPSYFTPIKIKLNYLVAVLRTLLLQLLISHSITKLPHSTECFEPA